MIAANTPANTPAKPSAKTSRAQTSRVVSDGTHEGFLRYARFRWAKIAASGSLIAGVCYALIDVQPRPNGGSWLGYTLGTIGTILILWLTMLGVRKRRMSRGAWSLKAWTSAHVYLGLSLIVIVTLHTGFQLGWNVHTLAYALMMLVILSGLWGIAAYATLPAAMSANRNQTTEAQMLAALRSVDRQLHDTAQPLEVYFAEMVQASLEQNPFGGGIYRRLTNRYPHCKTQAVYQTIANITAKTADFGDDQLEKIGGLLQRKTSLLARTRKHLQLKAMLEIWLYIHVPVTFALIAALIAHIISVFFYW